MSARTTRSTADQPRSRGGHSLSSPFFSALLCPFPALSLPETPEFPSISAKSSIVGYSQYALTKANQFVTTSFKNIGSEVIDLTTVKVVGYTGASTDKASVQFIDAAGNTAKDANDKYKAYFWRDADGASGKWVKKDGRNIIDVAAEEVVLNPGDGLWVQNEETATAYKLVFPAPTL